MIGDKVETSNKNLELICGRQMETGQGSTQFSSLFGETEMVPIPVSTSWPSLKKMTSLSHSAFPVHQTWPLLLGTVCGTEAIMAAGFMSCVHI